MKSQWLGIVLVAALIVGYGVLGNLTDDGLESAHDQPTMLGYYLKDAIIVETSESGAPHVRFAASDVTQDPQDDGVTLAAVRGDYMWPAARTAKNGSAPSNHWVLNADRAYIPAASKQRANRIELRGNVDAHSVAAPHNAVLTTQSLDIDTDAQIARTAEIVRVDMDGHIATGRGLLVDMEKNRVQLKAAGTLRLAANVRDTTAVSMPEVFEFDTFASNDAEVVLTKVRSKSEPFISADRARATGADISNNQWVLSGDVRLQLPNRGLVTAAAATVTVRNNRIVLAQLSGAPVNFQYQRPDSQQVVNGTAKTIDYDVVTQILRFAGDAWFSNGRFELKSDFQYNLATGEASGARGTGGLVPHGNSAPTDAKSQEPRNPDAKSVEPKE